MATTNIEWTDATWNPVTGCTKVSAGCKNCYAEGIADRFFAKQYPPNADGSLRKFTDVRCHPERLTEPRHWKKPRRVFVNSMSDLFHEDVPRDFIGVAFAIMRECPRHTFQILTKRAERMRNVVQWIRASETGPISPNIQLGVSVENQPQADKRIPFLLQTSAAVRFLSVEPQLEAVDLYRAADEWWQSNGIGWVICGGESGPGARPFNLAWAESLLKQCKAVGIPFFMKQVGSNPFIPEGYGVGAALRDRKGGDPAEWPEHLRVREWPS